MLIDWSQKIIQTKVVYYGPAMSGKTASIRSIFHKLNILTRLESIETTSGRTLFFDYGPIEIIHRDWTLQIHIWSATGQDYYAETRSTVLTGVDGIIFIADSHPQLLSENIRSWKELQNFFGTKLLNEIPVVFTLNKRDIIPAIDRDEFLSALQLNGSQTPFETIAIRGINTIQTLQALLRRILFTNQLAQ